MKAALCFLFILAFGDLTNGRSILQGNRSPSVGLLDAEKRTHEENPEPEKPCSGPVDTIDMTFLVELIAKMNKMSDKIQESGAEEGQLNGDILSLSFTVSELQSALQSASSSEGNLWMTVSSMLQTLVQSFGEDSAAFQQLYSYLVAKEIAALGLDESQIVDDMPSEDIQVADDMPSEEISANDVSSKRESPPGPKTARESLEEIRISVEQVSQMIKSQDASRQILVLSISAADTTLNLYNSVKGEGQDFREFVPDFISQDSGDSTTTVEESEEEQGDGQGKEGEGEENQEDDDDDAADADADNDDDDEEEDGDNNDNAAAAADDDDADENEDSPEDNNVETRLQDFKVKLLRELEKLRKS